MELDDCVYLYAEYVAMWVWNLGCVRLSTRVCMGAAPALMYGEGVEETLFGRFEIRIGLVDVIPSHFIP